MQPLCPATNSKSSLIQMLHTCGGDALAHGIGEAAKALGTGGVDPGDGGRNHGQAEQIRQQFGKPVLGQEMVVQQIDHKGADPRAILDRSRDQVRKRCPRHGVTVRARAAMSPMLGHDDLRFGHVKDLPGLVGDG